MCKTSKNKFDPHIRKEGTTSHFLHLRFPPHAAACSYGQPLLLPRPPYFPFAFLLILLPVGFQVHFSLVPPLLLVPSIIQKCKFKLHLCPIHRLLCYFFLLPALFLFRVKRVLSISAQEL